ncbi:hypothetical protein QYF36_024169 [Acer negundo]|nr:hypothetical protein QYF36_024169 [Acer negundo]
MASSAIYATPTSSFIANQKDLCCYAFSSKSQFSIHKCKKSAIPIKIMLVMTPQQSECRSATTGSVKTALTLTEKIWLGPQRNLTQSIICMSIAQMTPRSLRSGTMKSLSSFLIIIYSQVMNVQIVNPDYKGVCHVALAQEGHCRPGEVLLGTDSHTCTAGAFGQFATGIGHTDSGFVMGTGKLLLKVPPTLRFVMDGEMPDYLLAKDLILQIIGEISVSGATYKAMEFTGSTVESLTMEERMTLCNMVVEAGGKNGVVPADSITFKYLEAYSVFFPQDKTSVGYEPVYSDEKASFLSEHRFDVSKLEPLVAKVVCNLLIATSNVSICTLQPHSPDNRALARECKDVKIDRVYIGSCTGGKTVDFLAAAKVFQASGKKVKVPTLLVPATQKVWMDVYTLPVPGSGGKTCSQIFEEAGCDTPASPSCGACLGGPKDIYARMNEPMACFFSSAENP